MTTIGIYNYNIHMRGGGERKTAVMAEHFSRSHDVKLIVHHPVDLLELGAYFNTDLSRVKLVVLPNIQIGTRKMTDSHAVRTLSDSMQSVIRYFRLKSLRLDIFINNSPGDTLPNSGRHGIYMCMFPEKQADAPTGGFKQLLRRIRHFVGGSVAGRIKTYSVVTANSQYTSHWIDQWWRCPSKVIFSAPEDMGPPAAKEKIVLNVGRFSNIGGENHPKRQEVLLNAFKEMTDFHEAGWTLHFAGSVENTPAGTAFLDALRESAIGYPVEFHCNAKRNDLQDLYRRAAIYWHATGYGFSAETYPKRQEHLGLAPLEAMSAGAVPIVINSGGLRETVAHGQSGYRWDTLEELKEFTRCVAHDPALQETMSREAQRGFKPFSKDAFLARMDGIVESLLADSKMKSTEQKPAVFHYAQAPDHASVSENYTPEELLKA